ncbi:c-type cytochrome [Candidatus Peregrinibacteria bacterium]|nr:c-type cytochrome [Candidatus Peregrinibacteria bacterium]
MASFKVRSKIVVAHLVIVVILVLLPFHLSVKLPDLIAEPPARSDIYAEADMEKVWEPDIHLANKGKLVYEKYCIGCHGEKGDGNSQIGQFLDPRPRDFADDRALFKFRSTPSGSLPTDEDLLRTIRRGVHWSSMPSWNLVPEGELKAVVEYIKTLSLKWRYFKPESQVAIPEPPDYLGSLESADRGRKIYFEKAQCNKCHGDSGKGDGPSTKELKDDWGNTIKPFDFTRGQLKSGDTPKDVYRAFVTGINGTPMPSFAGNLSEEERWDVISFILKLRRANKDGK